MYRLKAKNHGVTTRNERGFASSDCESAIVCHWTPCHQIARGCSCLQQRLPINRSIWMLALTVVLLGQDKYLRQAWKWDRPLVLHESKCSDCKARQDAHRFSFAFVGFILNSSMPKGGRSLPTAIDKEELGCPGCKFWQWLADNFLKVKSLFKTKVLFIPDANPVFRV